MGRGTGEVFAAHGDRVVLADVNSNLGRQVAEEVIGPAGPAAFHDLDVREESSVNELIEWVEAEVGPIDVLVNSAGVLQNPMPITELPMEDHDRMWDINNRGLYMCCRAVAPLMKARGRGNIINIASTTSFVAWPLTAYDPGKTAVKMLTEVLAAEMGPKGIRVNAVAPHITATPAIQSRIDAGERDPAKIIAQNALPRMVEVEDVAEAIFFLCSPEAKAITGVTLAVDCGFLVANTYNTYPK
jgi:NAD(P)-dependent dehydrogenase (short-subunit alcohol dehydrogenase family)